MGGQNLGAHANHTPKLNCSEIQGGNVLHGGSYVSKRGCDHCWMVFNKQERVNTDGFQIQEFLLKTGIIGRDSLLWTSPLYNCGPDKELGSSAVEEGDGSGNP